MRVQFHHSEDLKVQNSMPYYSTVFLEGRELACFHHEHNLDEAEITIANLVEATYERARQETIKEMQNKFKELLGIK